MGKMKELDIEMKNISDDYSIFTGCIFSPDFWKSLKIKPVQVIYNPPYTIVNFEDGSKSMSKIHNEEFDFEKGLMAAIVKKVISRADFERLMNQGSKSFENKQKKNKLTKETIE
jgi:hypothetical protein